MTRILISYYKLQEISIKKTLVFWEGLAKELVAQGNDVFLLNTACCNCYDSNKPVREDIGSELIKRIDDFNPEVIITFNHRIIEDILKKYDVPIIIWDGDELSYFCDLDYIKKHKKRYKIFSIVKKWEKDYLDFGFKKEQILYIPPATAIKKDNITPKYNVSFLGARDLHDKKFELLARGNSYYPEFYEMIKEFLNTNNYNYVELFKKHFKHTNLNFSDRELHILFDYRWLVLSNMLDLGLNITGINSNWNTIANVTPQLLCAYHPDEIWNLKENSEYYNQSKISLSIQHPQARGAGFSWRCFDVMASNACLVTSESSELKELLKNNNIDIPMFTNPYEARTLCKKLLQDETLRSELVALCQEYVDKYARWPHRFRNIEDFVGVNLFKKNKPGLLYTNFDLYQVLPCKKAKKYLLEYKIWQYLDKKLKRKGII